MFIQVFVYWQIAKLVSIFTYDDKDTYWVGKVITVYNDSVELQLITGDAEWMDQ